MITISRTTFREIKRHTQAEQGKCVPNWLRIFQHHHPPRGIPPPSYAISVRWRCQMAWKRSLYTSINSIRAQLWRTSTFYHCILMRIEEGSGRQHQGMRVMIEETKKMNLYYCSQIFIKVDVCIVCVFVCCFVLICRCLIETLRLAFWYFRNERTIWS